MNIEIGKEPRELAIFSITPRRNLVQFFQPRLRLPVFDLTMSADLNQRFQQHVAQNFYGWPASRVRFGAFLNDDSYRTGCPVLSIWRSGRRAENVMEDASE